MKPPHVAPFTARVHHLRKLENYAYSCPHCKENSSFSLEQVRSSHSRRPSLLAYEIRRVFDAAYPINNHHEEFFIELHCEGCSSPVRLYFDARLNTEGHWEYFGSFVMELRSITPVYSRHAASE